MNGSRNNFTHHFVAVETGLEVGFLAVDINPADVYFVIYGIFVPPALRRQGIATRIIGAAEAMGRQHGYKQALLTPRTLDQSFAQGHLEDWYSRLGYHPLPNAAFQPIRESNLLTRRAVLEPSVSYPR
jgi:GNAT superfamily N-acetyltransferase